MSSKDAVAQNIMMNKALYRLVPILDRIVDGLKQAAEVHCFSLEQCCQIPMPWIPYKGQYLTLNFLETPTQIP